MKKPKKPQNLQQTLAMSEFESKFSAIHTSTKDHSQSLEQGPNNIFMLKGPC